MKANGTGVIGYGYGWVRLSRCGRGLDGSVYSSQWESRVCKQKRVSANACGLVQPASYAQVNERELYANLGFNLSKVAYLLVVW